MSDRSAMMRSVNAIESQAISQELRALRMLARECMASCRRYYALKYSYISLLVRGGVRELI